MRRIQKVRRDRVGRWATSLAGAVLASIGLCGCANFWDDVTSRDFKVGALWAAKPDPLVVLRDSTDGDQRAKALLALHEPKAHGGADQDQEMVLRILSAAAVNEKQPWCRLAAIKTLGHFKDPRAVVALRSAYDQAGNATNVIQQAAFQPGAGFPVETVAAIRCQALTALGDTQNDNALDLLVRVARQPPLEGTEQERQETLDEQIAAAQALGNFPQPQASEALLKVLQTEKDVALRDRAAESLKKITGKDLPTDAKAWDEALHAKDGKAAAAPKKKVLGVF